MDTETLRRIVTHPLAVALVIVLVSTVPFAVADAATTQPHTTDTEIIVGIQGPNNQGYVIKYDSHGREEWRYGDAASYHDVTALENGNILASYATGNQRDCGPYPAPCGRTGVRVIDPDANGGPRVVWEFEKPVRTMKNSEIHDAEVLPGGDIVYVDMDTEQIVRVNRSTKATSVLWDAAAAYRAPDDYSRSDWLHINDIDQLDTDGTRFLVSVRNRNQLLVVNTTQGVVDVVNRDPTPGDGYRKADPRVMRGQHNPQWLSENAVLVADSSNNRIIEFHRDTASGEWRAVWAVNQANGRGFEWPRDGDRLPNGNTLITDSRNDRVIEVDENGTVLNTWETAKIPYEADAVTVGEPRQAPTHEMQGEIAAGTGEGHLPGIGKLYIGLQHGIGLPAWMREYHLIALLAAFSFGVAGVSIETQNRLL